MQFEEPISIPQQLAQRVIDAVEPSLGFPMNIMNSHGVIIASSEFKRIGTYHRCGYESVAQKLVVRVEMATQEDAMLPGVNMPLIVNGSVCGAIGITGEPAHVEKFAQLVALNAELLIQREEEFHSAQRRKAQLRDMISALTTGHLKGAEVQQRLKLLGIYPPWKISARIGVQPLGKIGLPQSEGPYSELLGARWQLSGATDIDESSGNARSIECAETHDPEVLVSQAVALRDIAIYPGLFPSPAAKEWWKIELATITARTPQRALEIVSRVSTELSEELCNTVLILACHESLARASEKLFIHRNTLLQRISRIKQLTGLDPRITFESWNLALSIYAQIALGRMPISGLN